MQGKQDIGEEALSKTAEAGISSQLDEVEGMDVETHTNPGEVIQGEGAYHNKPLLL